MSERHELDQWAKARVEKFVYAIIDAAASDAAEGVAEYSPRSTGDQLLIRLNLKRFRFHPRNGDGKYARSLYTAAYWLYKTENPNEEEIP